MRMNWDKLFCEKRERSSSTKQQPYRNCFDMDYDRIVYSSSLRRLQDKAQVFPLQENDFTRTRLTHSLEVSAIGKSLGANIGNKLRSMGVFDEDKEKKLSSLLLVAGLVHDLGNPPFGHYGEDVIKEWFKSNNECFNLNGHELCDFTSFDGNAQTIRILTRLQFLNDKYGMNFCYGTLATLMKYPWCSYNEKNIKNKFGYFNSESKLCEDILNETGVINRHPATYLLEAADDISYLFADLEDALKKQYLPWCDVFGELRNKVEEDNDFKQYKYIVDSVELKRKNNEKNKVPFNERNLIDIQNFKISGQGLLIEAVCNEFMDNYDDIMEGKYCNKELLSCNKAKGLVEYIKDMCKKYAYQNREVLTLELVGKEVLGNLLNKFVLAAVDTDKYNDASCSKGKLYSLISDNFKYIQQYNNNGIYDDKIELSEYQRIQLVIDFISGMTDSYALNLNNKLLGMRIQ